ncbi:hypothetical protein pb186bvf_014200 [Paramecium bursaria]
MVYDEFIQLNKKISSQPCMFSLTNQSQGKCQDDHEQRSECNVKLNYEDVVCKQYFS